MDKNHVIEPNSELLCLKKGNKNDKSYRMGLENDSRLCYNA